MQQKTYISSTIKLEEWVEYGYKDLEDIDLEEITEKEYDEEEKAETFYIDSKFYRKI